MGEIVVSAMYLISVSLFSSNGDHRVLHVLTHSYPTRRSSDLLVAMIGAIVLTQRQRGGTRPQNIARQNARRPWEAIRKVQPPVGQRSEEHTSELQSLMRISNAIF